MNNSLMNDSLRFKIAHNVKNYIDLDEHQKLDNHANDQDCSHSDEKIDSHRQMITKDHKDQYNRSSSNKEEQIHQMLGTDARLSAAVKKIEIAYLRKLTMRKSSFRSNPEP